MHLQEQEVRDIEAVQFIELDIWINHVEGFSIVHKNSLDLVSVLAIVSLAIPIMHHFY